MMRELRLQGLDDQIYLWSDDNLSNDYFWQHLALEDIEEICTYPNYGKVCCFKGFDEISFSFNTRETPGLFGQQFEIMRRLLCLDLDLYCYATFTTPVAETIADSMARFIDRLQELDPNLPLRTVPLEIRVYEPTRERLRGSTSEALANQYKAVAAWREELAMRYSTDDLNRPITEVSLRNRRRVAKKSRATGPRVS
jgi:hypothetical protein